MDLASLADGFGDLQEGLGSVGPPHWAWSPRHTAAILKADRCPVFPQTGQGDGAARPEQLGGGWWQEVA